MSTLNEPIWSMCSIALTYLTRSCIQHTLTRKKRARIRMNVSAHQEKEKNEKTGKRKAGEERGQANDFKEAACCPSAAVQGAARRKNGLCEGSARGNWDPREVQQPFRLNSSGAGNHTITLRRLLIVQFNFARCIYSTYDRNFALRYSKTSESIMFWRRAESPY